MYMHEQLPSRTVTTACYGEEPNGTSTMDLTEKILINLLFPDALLWQLGACQHSSIDQ
jgi:hypothetical protein